MRPPLTDEQRSQVLKLARSGMSRNAVARTVGVSTSSVSRICQAAGFSFDRAATKAATEAKVADAKERRAALMNRYLDDAERLREQMWEPHEYRDHGGRDFVEQRWTQSEPTAADKLRLMQASTTATSSSMKLDLHDADQQGLAAVDAWLRDVTGG